MKQTTIATYETNENDKVEERGRRNLIQFAKLKRNVMTQDKNRSELTTNLQLRFVVCFFLFIMNISFKRLEKIQMFAYPNIQIVPIHRSSMAL